MNRFFGLFGIIFGLVWIAIWVFVVAAIVKSIKRSKDIRSISKDVFSQASNILKEARSSFKASDVDDEEEEAEAETPKYKYNYSEKFSDINSFDKKKTFSGKYDASPVKKSGRVYGINSSEKASHSKLSQESRDDEKEWF